MSIKIPQNQQIESKYTNGGEYVFEKTNAPYRGFYCEVNGKTYTGKEYISSGVSGSLPLIKTTSESYNKLLTNPTTALYGYLSKVNIPSPLNVTSLPFIYSDNNDSGTRYFIKKINDNLIKEINKDDYQKSQNDPLYQTVEVKFSYDMSDIYLSNLDKQMPGIKNYLLDDMDNNPTSSDEDQENSENIFLF